MNKLVKMAARSGNMVLAVWQSLWSNRENNNDVYLDNARFTLKESGVHLNEHQFSGYLSVLEKSGSYRRLDGFFGEVSRYKLAD